MNQLKMIYFYIERGIDDEIVEGGAKFGLHDPIVSW